MIKNDRMLAYLNTTVHDSILTRGSMSKSYAALGYSDWSNLPWSLHEVENISQVMNSTDLITSESVSEEKIKVMSQTGQLADYRIIHFATHGIVVPDLPELSAVVLSQFGSEQSKEDGYLRISEVSELNIKADLVNLSACETGLGKIYPGEGVVGLTQAFMLAGANAVSVSLWPVADEATSKFMISMYEKIANGSTYSSALNNTKLEFISGKFGDEYRKPYYWAPFVYYGN
jgi:CHAT domain-containing protein